MSRHLSNLAKRIYVERYGIQLFVRSSTFDKYGKKS